MQFCKKIFLETVKDATTNSDSNNSQADFEPTIQGKSSLTGYEHLKGTNTFIGNNILLWSSTYGAEVHKKVEAREYASILWTMCYPKKSDYYISAWA